MALQRVEGVCVHFHHSPPESRERRFGVCVCVWERERERKEVQLFFNALWNSIVGWTKSFITLDDNSNSVVATYCLSEQTPHNFHMPQNWVLQCCYFGFSFCALPLQSNDGCQNKFKVAMSLSKVVFLFLDSVWVLLLNCRTRIFITSATTEKH